MFAIAFLFRTSARLRRLSLNTLRTTLRFPGLVLQQMRQSLPGQIPTAGASTFHMAISAKKPIRMRTGFLPTDQSYGVIAANLGPLAATYMRRWAFNGRTSFSF